MPEVGSVALLAPIPLEHLSDGVEVCTREGKVAFGSQAWETLTKFEDLGGVGAREGTPAVSRVLIELTGNGCEIHGFGPDGQGMIRVLGVIHRAGINDDFELGRVTAKNGVGIGQRAGLAVTIDGEIVIRDNGITTSHRGNATGSIEWGRDDIVGTGSGDVEIDGVGRRSIGVGDLKRQPQVGLARTKVRVVRRVHGDDRSGGGEW